MALTKAILLVAALLPVADSQSGRPGGPGGSTICTDPPCAASLLGDVALTTVGGTGQDGRTFLSNENVYGPFEAGFGQQQDSMLSSMCDNPNVPTSDLYVQGGIDVYTVEQMIAKKCDKELPRIVNGQYYGILDQCGGHTNDYHFHESMSCLYSGAATGHSPSLAEVLAEDSTGSKQKLYGKWEDYNPAASTYVLPALDACNGHFGVTPDSSGASVYHYHTTDLPPFTVGCYGPAKSADNQPILVSPTTCRGLYTASDGCGGGDTIRVTTPTGSRNYDPWCPCWSGLSNVEGGESPSLPPTPPVFSPAPSSPTAATHTITMNSGWTWISSPFFEGNANSVFGTMSGLAVAQTDMIKNQLAFTNYIPGFGWFGQLENVKPYECYKVRLSVPGTMSFQGTLPNLVGVSITLNAGWTWLGWPALTAAPVSAFDSALSTPSLLNSQNDRMKSQFVFTSYIPGYGWFGDLTQFEPGLGYMVKLENANELVSFGATSRRKLEQDRTQEMSAKTPEVIGSGQWRISPSSFEYSMCVVAVVVVDGAVADDGDLAAFVNGQLHGVARPSSYKAPVGSYQGYKSYNLMAYGQLDTEGATVTFQYRHSDGRVSTLKPTMAFNKDTFLGSIQEPYVITHTTAAATATPAPTPAASTAPEVSTAPEASTAPFTAYVEASEPPADEKETVLNMGAVAAIAIGALVLVLLVVALCVRRATRSSESDKQTSTAEVVVPQKVDIDVASVSAA